MASSRGQATMETLFVMFMMFLLIGAIYQVFLIHNTLFQMVANAYYDAFKNGREKNNSDNSPTNYSSPITLAQASGGGGGGGGGGGSNNQSFPIIPMYQMASLGVSTQAIKNYWLESGTQGDPFNIAGMSSDVSTGNQQAQQQGPPQTGCGAQGPPDNNGNPETLGQFELNWIISNPHAEPPFPHTTSTDSHGLPVYGLAPNCGS